MYKIFSHLPTGIYQWDDVSNASDDWAGRKYELPSGYRIHHKYEFTYASGPVSWLTAHDTNKVQRLQNRAARISTGNYDYVNTRGIDLVKTLGLMNVSQRRDYFMIILMFKSIPGLVPNYLCDEITIQRDIAVRTTRSTINNNVHVPHITLECCKNAYAYRGPVLWNALTENIKKCESLNGFKQCIKLHVVDWLTSYVCCI